MSASDSPKIAVAGDVWIDFVGSEKPRPRVREPQPTDEARTFVLPGGALLLQTFIEAVVPPDTVAGPQFDWPQALTRPDNPSPDNPKPRISWTELQQHAGRLTPEEMPRSLLGLMSFAETRGPNKKSRRIRVEKALGFTGKPWPKLPVRRPETAGLAKFVVLDDTRGQFREHDESWPVEVTSSSETTFIHKLRPPFPDGTTQKLWDEVSGDPERHIVVVCADDLRRADISISRGLSWERTALDVVHRLRNKFNKLSSCRHLIVRLGIDGAIYWQSNGSGSYEASLIYDPAGIEGSSEESLNGKMVGYGSAFVAGILKCIFNEGMGAIPTGIQEGLVASRRLLRLGFGDARSDPRYPDDELFENRKPGEAAKPSDYFARRAVRIPSRATEVDPGYWRLLESIFAGEPQPADDTQTPLSEAEQKQIDAATEVARGRKPEGVELLRDAPHSAFGSFRTYDRREIEQYRALYSLMRDYVSAPKVDRPLNVAVFGPPGAGKSFGIKKLATELHESGVRALAGESSPRRIEHLTFNLSQYKDPAELAAAFHQVRDSALRHTVPLVFFDEFDSTLNNTRLGWLRYFLSPMQDGEFLDGGLSHPIGRAIFVFAGGTADSYEDFKEPLTSGEFEEKRKFREAKGPDFLSRLRAVLDIHGVDLDPDFDAYGRVENFPCEAAIRLRRAGILASLGKKRPQLCDEDENVYISFAVVNALLRVRRFYHGSRSFEALLDSSHLNDTRDFFPSSLASPDHAELHTDGEDLARLLMRPDVFADAYERMSAAMKEAPFVDVPGKYRMDARDVRRILQRAECSLSEIPAGARMPDLPRVNDILWLCAKREHNRWVADRRREGMVFGVSDDPDPLTDDWLVSWEELPEAARTHYFDRVSAIPKFLKKAGYVITFSSDDWIASGLKALERNRKASSLKRRRRLASPETPA